VPKVPKIPARTPTFEETISKTKRKQKPKPENFPMRQYSLFGNQGKIDENSTKIYTKKQHSQNYSTTKHADSTSFETIGSR
jgi:hypothetical protein